MIKSRRYWGIPRGFYDELEAVKTLAEAGATGGDEQLTEISRLIDAEKSDLYDVLAYIAYASAPMSRRERVLSLFCQFPRLKSNK